MLDAGGDWLDLHDDLGVPVPGVRGRAGACGITLDGHGIGADLLELAPGSGFPLHVHPGDHILYGLDGEGTVTVNGVAYVIRKGVTVFVAAEQPHAVGGPAGGERALTLIAFGVPHKHISSPERMKVVGR